MLPLIRPRRDATVVALRSTALAVIRRTTPASLRVSVFRRDSLGYYIEFVPTGKDVMGGWWQIRVFDSGATKVLGMGQ
jgi:hypothetical protein